MITWQAPLERANLVQYYTIKYRTDGQWKTLNKGQIRSEETSYLGRYSKMYYYIIHLFFKLKNTESKFNV